MTTGAVRQRGWGRARPDAGCLARSASPAESECEVAAEGRAKKLPIGRLDEISSNPCVTMVKNNELGVQNFWAKDVKDWTGAPYQYLSLLPDSVQSR